MGRFPIVKSRKDMKGCTRKAPGKWEVHGGFIESAGGGARQKGDNWALGDWRSQDQHIPETTMSSVGPLVPCWGSWDGGAGGALAPVPAGVATHHTVPSSYPVVKRWVDREENGDLHNLFRESLGCDLHNPKFVPCAGFLMSASSIDDSTAVHEIPLLAGCDESQDVPICDGDRNLNRGNR